MEQGIQNVRFRECRAEILPFENGSFDAVVCRFGIMFFSDPSEAVRQSLRVLKPGCRIASLRLGNTAGEPFSPCYSGRSGSLCSGSESRSGCARSISFRAVREIGSGFRGSGSVDIRERVFRFNIAAPLSFEHFFEVRSEMSDSLRAKLRTLPEQQRTAFKEEVRQNAQPYSHQMASVSQPKSS